ncbi:hypothetical protein JCM19294_1741 [Nonlabens tegetincola]|uniref:Uncharacterized protein n=1 Tax=Nonlabens tegetincola TaxID=323273 RepID=A0A090Q3A9_9FLAO|nr:hypothetical protein JCM19294_1741 [Nonlabens tegetincola]
MLNDKIIRELNQFYQKKLTRLGGLENSSLTPNTLQVYLKK